MNNEIILKVLNDDSQEINFKIKQNTKLSKIFKKYCELNEINDINSIRFLYNGEKIKKSDTPKKLNMETGDEIEARIEQMGGNF